jgi:hypothetical protein
MAIEVALAQLPVDQVVQQTGARLPLLAVDQLAEVRLQPVAGVEYVGGLRAAQQPSRLRLEEVVVGVGDAEQGADHHGRHGQCEGAHQVRRRALGGHRVEPFVHDLPDAWPEFGGPLEGEVPDDHPPLGAVLGVVDAQQGRSAVADPGEALGGGGEAGPVAVGRQTRVGQQRAGGGVPADEPGLAAVEEGDPGQGAFGAQCVIGGGRVVGAGPALGEDDGCGRVRHEDLADE